MYSFPLEDQELIIKKGLANLYCNGEAYAGALYLTSVRMVFVGYLLDIENKYIEEIPLAHIEDIGLEKTFFVIPNVIVIRTIKDRRIKFIVRKRDSWFEAINRQIKNVH